VGQVGHPFNDIVCQTLGQSFSNYRIFMSIKRSHCAKTLVLAGGMMLTLVVGCSTNPNEDEFLKSAPPGAPSEFPNESVAQRKARTLGPSKPVKGGGAKKSTGAKTP
jgi:hypothetical protein